MLFHNCYIILNCYSYEKAFYLNKCLQNISTMPISLWSVNMSFS